MKKFLLPALLIFPVSVFAQNVFEQIDTVNASKSELYKRAKLWVVNYFNDAQSVIEVDDKETGNIIGKGNCDIILNWPSTMSKPNRPGKAVCDFSFQIDCRDNKARIKIYDIKNVVDEAGDPPGVRQFASVHKRFEYGFAKAQSAADSLSKERAALILVKFNAALNSTDKF